LWCCTTKKRPADKFCYAAGGDVAWFAVFINTNKAAFDERDIGFADVLRECSDVINTNVAKVSIEKDIPVSRDGMNAAKERIAFT
jgi:hypothetical protein